MRNNIVVAVFASLPIVFASYAAAATPVDATVTHVVQQYVPTPADLAYTGQGSGDMAIANVHVVGDELQYTGLVLNGDGVNADAPHPFLKVQEQNGGGTFDHGACYLGNNSSAGSFGLGFFNLTQPFQNAVMVAIRKGSTVTILLLEVNDGALPSQKYVCTGAPAPVGTNIGVNGYAANTARLDNFTAVLDTFSYTGPLGSTGNWNDAAPGMYANGSGAQGGPLALSFWIGPGARR